MKRIKTRSSYLSLFFNGKIEHFINPWNLVLDFKEETLTIEKRNWYFVGVNSQTLAFRFLRKISINEHLFGADIRIKVIGGAVSAKYLPKRDLLAIRSKLIEYNETKKRNIIFS